MAKLFGFVQFDFAGTLPLGEGRYLAGEPGSGEETVLVLQRLGAPVAERRRRLRPTPANPDPAPVALTRATVIRAATPLLDQAHAARWLDETCDEEEAVDALTAAAIKILNRALHVQAVATADPYIRQLSPAQAERVLIGYGSGEETADGQFADARQVDAGPRTASRRRQREEELRPQERVSAILRGREQLDACETLLLRARADLDAGRIREAALQLRIGLEALLVELEVGIDDPDHLRDMSTLEQARAQTRNTSVAALQEAPTPDQRKEIESLLEMAERILRRRRILSLT